MGFDIAVCFFAVAVFGMLFLFTRATPMLLLLFSALNSFIFSLFSLPWLYVAGVFLISCAVLFSAIGISLAIIKKKAKAESV